MATNESNIQQWLDGLIKEQDDERLNDVLEKLELLQTGTKDEKLSRITNALEGKTTKKDYRSIAKQTKADKERREGTLHDILNDNDVGETTNEGNNDDEYASETESQIRDKEQAVYIEHPTATNSQIGNAINTITDTVKSNLSIPHVPTNTKKILPDKITKRWSTVRTFNDNYDTYNPNVSPQNKVKVITDNAEYEIPQEIFYQYAIRKPTIPNIPNNHTMGYLPIQYTHNNRYLENTLYDANIRGTNQPRTTNRDVAKIVNSWKLKFSGKDDNVDEFLVRINECKTASVLTDEELLGALPLLLVQPALNFYRNKQDS